MLRMDSLISVAIESIVAIVNFDVEPVSFKLKFKSEKWLFPFAFVPVAEKLGEQLNNK